MTNSMDPVPHWTRQLAHLRTQALRRARHPQLPGADIIDNALETCDGLLRELAGARLECERLQEKVRSSTGAWKSLFELLPVACLLTDRAGSILDANRAAGVVLRLTPKRLKDRELVVFSEDRVAFGALLHQLARGGREQLGRRIVFRPREHRPVIMDVIVAPLPDEGSGIWLWFLTPAAETETGIDRDASYSRAPDGGGEPPVRRAS